MQKTAEHCTEHSLAVGARIETSAWKWRWNTIAHSVELTHPNGHCDLMAESAWLKQVASQDRRSVSHWRTLLSQGEIARYQLVFRWDVNDRISWVVETARRYHRSNGSYAVIAGKARPVAFHQHPRTEPQTHRKSISIDPVTTHGLVACDRDGIVRRWNARVEAITGLSVQDVLERPIWEVQAALSPATVPYERAIRAAELESRRVIARIFNDSSWREVFEYELLTSYGAARWIESIVFQMTDGGEDLAAVLVADRTVKL